MSSNTSNPARSVLGFLSFALISGGISGILREAFDWSGSLFGFLRFLVPDGHEYFGYSVITVIGVAVGVAASRVGRTAG